MVPPSGPGAARLDYVAIPRDWQVPHAGSRTDPALDWGQPRTDHVALQTWIRGYVPLGNHSKPRRPRLNTAAMRTSEGQQVIREICRGVPLQPWSLDVHRHAKAVEDHLWAGLLAHFPAPKSPCKRDYFCSDTWQLRGKREWLRKRIHAASKFFRVWELRGALSSWKCRRPLCVVYTVMYVPLLWLLRDFPAFLDEYRLSCRELRRAIRRDTLDHIRRTADDATNMSARTVVQRLRMLTGGPKRKSRDPPPLPAVELANGSLAATAEDAKERWLEHFSSIEDGHVQDAVSIVHDCFRRQAGKDLEAYSVNLQDVPDLCSLEGALRDTATARAYGQDGVPGEVAHYCAAELSKAIFQLHLKSVFRLCEPVQHKGGVLHCVWKRKGPKQQCTSYRGILVSSVIGKSLHKLLRQKCITALSKVASPLQVVGLPKYPVTVPAHATRLFQSACHRQGLCHSIVFLDLQEAFYRIVRPLITGGPLTQEAVAAACRAVNLPSGVYHEVQAHLQQPALPQGGGASEWATRALEETLQDTWFKFPCEPELVVTKIGSRPGDSLSDLVFSLLFAKVLARIRQILREAGHVTTIPWHASMTGRLQPVEEPVHDTVELLDSTWMDDLSLMLRAQNSTALLDRLRTGTAVLLDACLEHALLPNLGRGKTEALVMLRSSGTKEARRRLFIEEHGTLPLDCRLWPSARLRITPTYKHLGGILHHRGHLQREVKARTAQAWTAFNQRKQKVFASPAVAPRDKMSLFDTLVATVLFYGCGTWPTPSDACISSLQGALRGMASQMLRPVYTTTQAWHLGTDWVFALLGMPSASTYLHVHRLRYLLSCLILETKELWALAHWEQSWLSSVASSVEWLWQHTDNGSTHATWQIAWASWSCEARTSPGKWKARIRAAQQCAVLRERWRAMTNRHQGLLYKQLCALGAQMPVDLLGDLPSQECCAPCQRRFGDLRAWAVHAFSVHGRVEESRCLATGTQCPVCLQQYSSNVKLSRHIRYSVRCRSQLLATNHRTAPEPGTRSRKAPDDGLCLLPILQAEGPRPLQPTAIIDAEPDRPSAEVLDCLAHLDFDGSLEHCTAEGTWARLRQSFSCVCLQSSRIRATAQCWREHLQHAVQQGRAGPYPMLLAASEWICQADTATWLVTDLEAPACAANTFKSSGLFLSILECTHISLPQTCDPDEGFISVHVGEVPLSVPDAYRTPPDLCYPHSDTLRELARDTAVDFLESYDQGCRYFLSTLGLPLPHPENVPSSRKDCTAQHEAAQLAGDLVRLAVHHWSRGIRSCLILPSSADPAYLPILRVSQLQCVRNEGHIAIHN